MLRRIILALCLGGLIIGLLGCEGPQIPPDERSGFVFRDTADAGNDPETPGCHYRWDYSRPPSCGIEEWHELHSGDACKSDTELYEWVSRDCHEPSQPPDREVIDCQAFCEGRCVVDKGVCADPRGGPAGDSAHCVCTTPPPPELRQEQQGEK